MESFNQFDVATKELVWEDPSCMLGRLGIDPTLPTEVIESGITTLTAAADKVIRVGGPSPFLLNIEFQGSHETELVRTLWFRQVALDYQHDLAVVTMLILLRKEANSPSLTGVYERNRPDGRPTNRYHYEVVRLWEEAPEVYLSGSVALVPLAPLTAVREADLPGLIRRMAERIDREPPLRAEKLWGATYLLMGLRFADNLIDRLFEGVRNMTESTTYQKILREGREKGIEEGEVKEARRFLRMQASIRFGDPNDDILKALDAIGSLERLEDIGRRFIEDPSITGWDDLLRDA